MLVSLRIALFPSPHETAQILRVAERGSSWGTLPKQRHTLWEKLIVLEPFFDFRNDGL